MIVILWLVCANPWVSSADPHTINKMVGSHVTFVPQYTGDPSEINWRVNGNKLVAMEVKPQVDILFYRLQDRATISDTDGSLTIRDLTKGDSGVYKAEVLVNNVYQETEIKLIVSVPHTIKMVGSHVTLVPQYTGDPSEMNWKVNGNKLVDMELKPWVDVAFYRLQNRATISATDGSLTIRDLTKGDSGIYKAEVLVNNVYQETEIKLIVSVPHTINKMVGSDVTLLPQYTRDPSEINWKVNGYKLVDMELKPRVDIVFYYLQDRATISDTDGSLTIRDLTIGDSGVYKAEALVNNVYQETEIKLIVSVPHTIKMVGSHVTLVPQYTGDPTKINWKVNGNKLVDMELKPRVNVVFYRLKDRANISDTDGSLTIRDLTIGDSGFYKAEALVNNVYQETEIKLFVSVSHTIKMVGSHVTLVPQYTGDPSEINWKVNGNKLVDMELKPRVDVVFYLLQNRVTISATDGSLTIRDLTIRDSGVYKAEALVNNVYQETEIKLFVSVPHTIKMVGSLVTLVPQYTGDPSEINWRVNGNKLVDMELKPRVNVFFYRLQDRATISDTDGSLTIRDLTIGDSGVYKVEALVNNVYQETELKLIVSVPHTINKMVGSHVTLVPQYTGDPSEMNWRVNGNKLVDMELKPRGDVVFYRLQDRATINDTVGSLTIRDLTIKDSGVYKAEALVNNVYQETETNLIVSGP